MFIESSKQREIINEQDKKLNEIYEKSDELNYKNYRKSKCLKCNKKIFFSTCLL